MPIDILQLLYAVVVILLCFKFWITIFIFFATTSNRLGKISHKFRKICSTALIIQQLPEATNSWLRISNTYAKSKNCIPKAKISGLKLLKDRILRKFEDKLVSLGICVLSFSLYVISSLPKNQEDPPPVFQVLFSFDVWLAVLRFICWCAFPETRIFHPEKMSFYGFHRHKFCLIRAKIFSIFE